MNRSILLADALNTHWAVIPERLATYSSVLHRWASGQAATHDVLASIEADKTARAARSQSTQLASSGGIAVLKLYGVITQRGNMLDDLSGAGATSTQKFSNALREALADDSIGQILIDIDSPGGNVYGVGELAAEIFAARGQKPIVAIANSLAASAAYWIGAQASEFYVTPGGEVGSIGVYMMHQDCSAYMEAEGIKTTFIQAGAHKTEGNGYAPLGAEAQEFLQSRTNDYYTAFIKAVAKGRGVNLDAVRNDMGQGRCFGADAALAAKMVDGIATFDDVLRKMQKQAKSTRTAPQLARAQRELSILG